MKRFLTIAIVAATATLGSSGIGPPVQAKAPGTNGQIAFTRQDPMVCKKECGSVYAVNPDGTHEQKLLSGNCCPNWSPDGSKITVLPACSFGGSCAGTVLNVNTGAVQVLPNPNPALYNEFFSCNRWSPDGARLACAIVSDTPGVTGVYTVRSSDGGGLTKAFSCLSECGVDDWSPDGKRFLLGRVDATTNLPALFVVRTNGTGLRQITPSGMDVDLEDGVAGWSPNGTQIVFGGRTDPDHRRSIFVVNPDGAGLRQLPVAGCGGAFADPQSIACFDPTWSPDGSKIVFVRSSTMFGTQAVYTANVDGSGLSQVSTATNHAVFGPDWGSHPLAT